MALDIDKQFETAMRAVQFGDIELAARILTDPNTVGIKDQRTVAQRYGIKGGFLSAAVNIVSDPVVWMSYLMSRRFPTLNWLKGTIPTRFIGAANDWNGLGMFTRPVETYFRGTEIPKLVALKQQRETEVMNVGKKMFDRFNRRPNWKNEKDTVSLILEGQHPQAETPELRGIANGIRADMDELWHFLRQSKKIRGGFRGDEITTARAEDWLPNEAPRHLRDYLPHIPLLGDESVMTLSGTEALKKIGMSKAAQMFKGKGSRPQDVWTASETDALTSDFTRYQSWLNQTSGQLYDPRLMRRQRTNQLLGTASGQELFITDLDLILQKYVHSTARTYAINAPLSQIERALATTRFVTEEGIEKLAVPTSDPIMVQIINKGLQTVGVKTVQRRIAGTNKFESVVTPGSDTNPIALRALQDLTKAVAGKADEGEILFGNLFSAIGRKFDTTVGNLTGKQRSAIDQHLTTIRRNSSQRNIFDGATSYFYASTLGMNPWSAMQNMLQPILTTAPAIGIGPTLKGMSEFRRRVPMYAKEMRVQHAKMRGGSRNPLHRMNEAAEEAFRKTFPELTQSGIRLDPRMFDIDPNATIRSLGQSQAWKTYDDFAKFLLQPFTHAEMRNQAVTFFGARGRMQQALQTGEMKVPTLPSGRAMRPLEVGKWLDMEAGNVVNASQFRPGPGSRSIFQGLLPAPFRQFSSFPTRFLSFMTESTVRGAMTQQQLQGEGFMTRMFGGRNWGTLARMTMYSRIATTGAREVLGVNLEDAMGVGAGFRFTPKDQWLAPFPLPPAADVLQGLVSYASNRDLKELQPLELPGGYKVPIPKTLIPAGVQINRMARAMNQFQPDAGGFVDENERLMRQGTTTDFIMAMLGLPSEKQRRTRDVVETLGNTRMKIRDFRRKYAVAKMNADWKTMDSLRAQYAKAFKDLPPLDISAKDLDRYRRNARMPALQRMLQGMGTAGRFLEAEIYEVDPSLLAPQPQAVGFGQ